MADLREKSKYTVRALAENAAGVGKPSDELQFVAKDEFDPPGKPGTPDVEAATETSFDLQWTAPKSDGGSPITNYVVEVRIVARLLWLQF